ncbi:MAG: beta-lactamase, partial [Caulobacter sp.]|nr:beta-lactamase [Caulobacter sp.]
MALRLSSRSAALVAVVGCWLATASAVHAQDAVVPPPAEAAAPTPSAAAPPRRRVVAKPAAKPATPPAATAAPAVPPSTATPLSRPELEAFVDGLVRRAMADDHVAGAAVAVVQNGQVVLKKGYGAASLSEGRPVDPDRTLFRIGSISKTFTWIALMNEIEAGRMRMDAPVNLYLPERLQLKDQGQSTPVRLRDLMTHTPGFEDRMLGQLFERDWRRVRPLAAYLRQERPKRVREPGLLPAYSNYGAALAGAAVANVTGKPFETLIADEILLPAGLYHTTFREPRPWRDDLPAPMAENLAGDVSNGFHWTPLGWRSQPFEYVGQIAPAGSASSTPADMARYMTLLLNGGVTPGGRTIFSPRTSAAFRTPLYRPAPGAAGWNAGFRDIALPGDRHGFGHDGSTLTFHANMVLAPDLGLGVFVVTNTDSGGALTAELPGAIVEHFYAPRPPLAAPSLISLDEARAYEGDFLTTRRAYGGLEGFIGRIMGLARVKATPDGRLSITTKSGPRLWTAGDQPGVFKAMDGADALAFDPRDGGAARFFASWGGETYERVAFPFQRGLLVALAALTAVASVVTLAGVFMRNRREFRQTQSQSRAALMQTTQAVLWLVSMASFAIFASRAGDTAKVFFNWPGGWLLTASACALVASV